jgi:WD40 repeat protein
VSNAVHDALRFAMWSGSGVQEAPLQVYYGALVFAPTGSVVRRQFLHESPKGIAVKTGLDEEWGPLLQTLEGHTSEVSSLAFPTAGDQLASALLDRTVRVWDAKTVQPLHTLEGHTGCVTSVTFSRDDSHLVTDRGPKLLSSLATSISTLTLRLPTQHVCVKECWLMVNSNELLWIPANYRPRCIAFYSGQLAFGYSSGSVFLLEML